MTKKLIKKTTKVAIRKEIKLLAIAVLSIATHRLVQKAVQKYPALGLVF